MWTFFHGWKRKIGVVMLGPSSALVVLWIRSVSYCDTCVFYVACKPNAYAFFVQSERSAIAFARLNGDEGFDFRTVKVWSSFRFNPSRPPALDQIIKNQIRWQFYGAEFREGLLITGEGQISTYVLHYWIVVIPLTLITAWCLLSNPRSKPRTISAPDTTVSPFSLG